MNSAPRPDAASPLSHVLDALGRIETWLDDHGKGAWIALIVLAFIFFWPVGLALMVYALWGRRRSPDPRPVQTRQYDERPDEAPVNAGFEAYKAETLDRLSDEQGRFDDFVDHLQTARDKEEFDDFLDARARKMHPRDEPDSR